MSGPPATVRNMGNRRRLGRWLIVPAAALAVMLGASPASADPVSDAGSTLHSGPIYIEPGAMVKGHPVQLNKSAVSSAFGSTVKVAIFADGKSIEEIDAAGNAIEPQLGPAVLAVFSGNQFDADSNLFCGTPSLLKSAVAAHTAQMSSGNYTDTLVAFANAVSRAPHKPGANCVSGAGSGSSNGSSNGTSGAGSANNGFDKSSGSSSGGSRVWPWLVGIAAVIAAAFGARSLGKRRRRDRELNEAKAAVMPYYDRLASEVGSLNAGGDASARQALADASERYNSAGSQMSTATTVAQWAAIRRTVLEGLQAAQTARTLLKLPAGPDVPPVDEPRGEQLSAQQQVVVQGQQYTGFPAYTPGAPYYYGGGAGYPGGWYTFPFWETMLVGSMLGGGFGGGGWGWGGGYGGGGYGAGFENGYQAGENDNDNAGNSGDAGGGSWGGFGDSGGGWGGFGDGGGGGFGDGGGGGGGNDGGSF